MQPSGILRFSVLVITFITWSSVCASHSYDVEKVTRPARQLDSRSGCYLVINATNKFCYTDQETGVKTEVILIDGGEAEINFYGSNGTLVRRGEATWRGSNDGVGGDMPKIYLRLSTGVTLTFRAVVDQYTSRISSLIDSRDNMWGSCF